MADRFASYEELAKVFLEDRDYRVVTHAPDEYSWLIMAPHGGKIERGTSELARAVATDEHGLYLFEGLLQRANRDLHVGSHRFFENRLDALLAKSDYALGIHGRGDDDDPETVFVGGRNAKLKTRLEDGLKEAGFKAQSENHRLPGEHPKNTCNRCGSGAGVQLELPLTLRVRLLDQPELLERMAGALRGGLA